VKKSGRVVLAIVAVVIVFAGIVSMIVCLRSRALADREYLTVEELIRLAKTLQPPAITETSEPVQTEDAADPGSNEPVHVPVPTRLKRVPTPEILTERFANNLEHRRENAIRAEMMKVVESILWTVGAKTEAKDWTRGVGRALLWAGKWDGARRYLYETLRTTDSNGRFRGACAQLAWLEQDPTKAARLLELSLQGDDEWLSVQIELAGTVNMVAPTRRTGIDRVSIRATLLANAVELTGATGSRALESHYLELLRVESAELARNFGSEADRQNN